MAVHCRQCSQANPSDASYCYFDGVSLLSSQVHGPLDLARAPFPQPFLFPTGPACQNFDQLALTCQANWHETKQLLRSGAFEAFLGRIGRADLMRVVIQAAAQADADRGVDYFLARLPARNMMPPRLHVEPAQQHLGTLKPGQDRQFMLTLANHGHRLIAGSVSSDCAWLQVEGATPDQPRLIQFPHEQTIVVRVAGSKLAASQKPLQGRVIVSTDAGTIEVPIACEVPIRPFPEGVLKDCSTPRELAREAKHHPEEAATLFFDGKVKAWYTSNGWTYPVEGEPASGKAAVQQFFEALGLTTPPRVVLDTAAVGFRGAPGERLQQNVELHTDEKRPIFAFGKSLSPWLTVLGSAAQGNRAVIAIEVNVPNTSASKLEGKIEVRANGNQRFRVPVVLHIDAPSGSPNDFDVVRALQTTAQAPAASSSTGGCLFKSCLACSVLAMLMIVVPAAFVLYTMRHEIPALNPSSLKPYAAAISPQTCVACAVNLDAFEGIAGLEKETAQLRAQIAQSMRDLELESEDAGPPRRLFVALEADGTPLLLWTFASPVKIGKVVDGRYEDHNVKGQRVCVDRLEPRWAWAVDGQGRLLHGTKDAVHAVLEREKTHQPSSTYAGLAHAVVGTDTEALAWAAGDFQAVRAAVLDRLLGADNPPLAVTHFRMELVTDAKNRHLLRGRGSFPSPADAAACRDALRGGLPEGAIPFLPGALDFNKFVLTPANWDVEDNDLLGETILHATTTNAFVQVARLGLKDANQRVHAALDAQCRAFFQDGIEAEKKGQYAQAASVFERAVAKYPRNSEARKRLSQVKNALNAQEEYLGGLAAAREALEKGNVDAARATAERLKQSPAVDSRLAMLEKDIAGEQLNSQVRAVLKEARASLTNGDLERAHARFAQACKLNPEDRDAAGAFAAVKLLREVQDALRKGDEALSKDRPEAAQQTVMKSLNRFFRESDTPLWREEPFKTRREYLLKDGEGVCRRVVKTLQAAATQAETNAERAIANDPTEAVELYDKALLHLDQAQAILADVRKITRDNASTAAEIKAIIAQVEQVQQGKRRIGSLSLLAKANKELDLAKGAMKEATADPTRVAGALASLETAQKCFREAEALKEPVAAKLDAVDKLRQRLERVLHPVALDLGKELPRTDWRYEKNPWAMKETPDGKQWLEAPAGEVVMLESASADWPAEFELEMEFALLDAKGKVNNGFWSSKPDPLTLTLHHAGGNKTTIALGTDPSSKQQSLARLQVNGRAVTVENEMTATMPLRLVVRCKKRMSDDRRILTVTLGRRDCDAHTFTDEVQNLQLRVAAPKLRTLAIYRLEAAWLGAKNAKAKEP